MFPKEQKQVKKPKKNDVSQTNREEIKKLFKWRCGLCGALGTHTHHIKFRSEAPDRIDDLDNLFYLCVECHQKVHSNKKYWQPRLERLREKYK